MPQRITVRPSASLEAIKVALENSMEEINARSAEIVLRRQQGRRREVARLEHDQSEAWETRRSLLREQAAAQEGAHHDHAPAPRRRAH